MNIQEEYEMVRVLLQQYAPYTYSIRRALELLDLQQKKIKEQQEELEGWRNEFMI